MRIEITLHNNNHPVFEDSPKAISTSVNVIGFTKLTAEELRFLRQDFHNLLKRLE